MKNDSLKETKTDQTACDNDVMIKSLYNPVQITSLRLLVAMRAFIPWQKPAGKASTCNLRLKYAPLRESDSTKKTAGMNFTFCFDVVDALSHKLESGLVQFHCRGGKKTTGK